MTLKLLRLLVPLALVAWLLLDWHVLHGPVRRWIESQTVPDVAALETMRMQAPAAVEKKPAVARVGELSVEMDELREAMRDHLWRTGQVWEALPSQDRDAAARAVLQRLVDLKIVRQTRVAEAAGRAPGKLAAAVDRELDQLKREFDQDQDFAARLALRQTTEEALRKGIEEEIADQDWIELQLSRLLRPVDETDVRRWIDEHPADAALEIPAAFHVAHIYLTTHDSKKPDREPEIRELARRLKVGEATFEVLAAEFSDDERTKAKGGDLGWVTRRRMPGDFMECVSEMTVGQTSDPVRTALGWHILRLLEKKDARAATTEETAGEIAAMLAGERRTKAMEEWMAGLRKAWSGRVEIDGKALSETEPAQRRTSGG